MVTVTIPKKEYEELVEKRVKYEWLKQIIEGNTFASPPIKNANEVLAAFKSTKKYSRAFLESLKVGLKRSSYFRIWKFCRFIQNLLLISKSGILRKNLKNRDWFLNTILFIQVWVRSCLSQNTWGFGVLELTKNIALFLSLERRMLLKF